MSLTSVIEVSRNKEMIAYELLPSGREQSDAL